MDKKTKKQKEKIKHRAINWKLVSEFCRGTAGHFILGTLGIVFAALSAYCIPLITSFTIDYVLIGYAEEGYSGGIAVAPWIERLIDSIGGIPFLEQHLYIMGIALIAATGVNALSVYIRRSQIAYGAEINVLQHAQQALFAPRERALRLLQAYFKRRYHSALHIGC